MNSLLKIELIKTFNSRSFRLIGGLYVLLLPLGLYVISTLSLGKGFELTQIYHFPDIWKYVGFIASYFTLILALAIGMLNSSEYEFNTVGKQIAERLNRSQFLLVRFGHALGFALFCMVYLIIIVLIFGAFYSSSEEMTFISQNSHYALLFLLQCFGYFSLAILFSTIFKSGSATVILFLLYFIIIEPLINYVLPFDQSYLPAAVFSNLIPIPDKVTMLLQQKDLDIANFNLYLSLLYLPVLFLINKIILDRRDLSWS